MVYAPIIIPTLNRYEHFKQCLESLEKCSWAEFTDVYVGLDYPPSEKYVEGWGKIDAFLRLKENHNAFHLLKVFRREVNCGMGLNKSNLGLLGDYVRERYDRYVVSEDDNVFSPNFLEYINKGLERYKDDSSVFAIVGYAHPYHFMYADNNHYRHNTDMSTWGFGVFVNRYMECLKFMRNGGVRQNLSIGTLMKFRGHGLLRLFDMIHYAYHKGRYSVTDGAISVYLIMNDMYVITPAISKVRNIGWDCSGSSFSKGMSGLEMIAARHNNQQIDTAEHFEYVGDDTAFMDYNNHIAAIESDGYMSFWQFVAKLWKSFFKLPQ